MQPFMFPLATFVAGQVALQGPAAGILRPPEAASTRWWCSTYTCHQEAEKLW